MTPCPMLTAEEAAAIARCQPSSIEAAWRAGTLPGFKLGPHWVVPESALYEGLHRLAMANLRTPDVPAPAGVVTTVPVQSAANDTPVGRGRRRALPKLPSLPAHG